MGYGKSFVEDEEYSAILLDRENLSLNSISLKHESEFYSKELAKNNQKYKGSQRCHLYMLELFYL